MLEMFKAKPNEPAAAKKNASQAAEAKDPGEQA
jgi:hypothetical protein